MNYSRQGLNYERKGKKRVLNIKKKKKTDWVNVILFLGLAIIIIIWFLR